MYQKMLVPLDGSELAEIVLTYVKELAGRLDIDVVLLQVSTPVMNPFVPMHRAYIEHKAEELQRQVEEVQKKSDMLAGTKPVRVRSELIIGYPPEEILRYAEEKKIDLIVMATHGRSGLRRWVLGSVADKVLRTSTVPVWLVRPGHPDETPYDQWTKRTIIVPLDGSDLAELVLPQVKVLAKQRGTEPVEVALLRVCQPPSIPSYSTPELPDVPLNWGDYIQQETARCKQTAKEYLAGIEKQFKEIGVNVRSEVLVGKAAEEIVDYAKRNPFNVVVMATHGRSGLSRWVYGSVTENVLQAISSPALLIRTHEAKTQREKGK